ncbi:MAG: hypothetical protein R3C61_07480 [Bacteroidia bacterium]
MSIRILAFTLLTFSFFQAVYAQLGISEHILTEKYGKQTIRRTTPSAEGYHDIMFEINPGYFLLAKVRESDSLTVLLSYSMRNPAIGKQTYNKIVKESFSSFKPEKKFTSKDPFDLRTCHYNPEAGEMVMRIHGSRQKEFPLRGFLLVNDVLIIDEILLTVNGQWEEEE